MDPMEMQAPADEKMIQRDTPEPDPSRAALVKQWQDDVLGAKKHWKKDFDRMRRNMEVANGKQWPGQKEDDDRYMVNLVQRVLKTTVSALYAKNPTAIMSRRKRLDFKLWDGKPESAMQAVQTLQAAAAGGTVDPMTGAVMPPDPAMVMQAVQLVQDIQQGVQHRELLDKIGETLVCLLDYFLAEGKPTFKGQMKRVVRRARTTGVGYVKLGFQRAMQLSEEQNRQIADFAERLAVIGRLQADIADGETDPYCSETEELRLAMQAIQNEPEVIVREGLVFSFPHSTRIIPSISTESLMEWVGSEWVAEEIMLTPNRVKEVYGKDVGSNYTAYKVTGGTPQTGATSRAKKGKDGLVCVWHVYDKVTGLELVIAEGYPEFLKEPASPEVFVEQFFPVFAVTFNEVEDEGELFPKSDVELLKHVQREYNRSGEAKRQHRIAARPLYFAPKGVFEEEEVKSLAGHEAHSVIELNALDKGMKAEDLIMPVKKHGVDPNLYDTNPQLQDMSFVTGNSEAVLGSAGNATATAENIAESSRQGSIGLDSDDLDDMFTELFKAAGQILLTELDEATVKDIVGPGAVWPQMSRMEIMKEVGLEVKAGSSGRPDAAREAATFERIYPALLQVPGISPRWLAERMVKIADDNVDLEEAVIDGLPSILSMNKAAQMSTGDPASDPNAQGEEGGDKDRTGKPGGTSQPQFPGAGANTALQ